MRKFLRNLQGALSRVQAGAAPVETANRAAGSTPVVFDPFSEAFLHNPYPTYDALRRDDPVHRSVRGAWAVSRHEDVVAALADARLGNAPSPLAATHPRNAGRYTCASVASQILPFLDPPTHAAYRRVVVQCFKQQLADAPPALAASAERQLLVTAHRDELDVLADFATPYTLHVMSEVLGFEPVDVDRLATWADAFFYLLSVIPSADKRREIDAALGEFRAHVTALLHARIREPRADLLTRLAQRSVLGSGDFSVEAAADNCMLVFADGIENVDRGIAACMLLLLSHPEQWRAVCEDPALIAGAVEECLRMESPAQFIARTALCSFELQGRNVREGETVLLLLGSANRDPNAIEEPEHFNIHRAVNPHLSFGRGKHGCIGGQLAIAQITVAIAALARELPSAALAPCAPSFLPRPGHRWLSELLVLR